MLETDLLQTVKKRSETKVVTVYLLKPLYFIKISLLRDRRSSARRIR